MVGHLGGVRSVLVLPVFSAGKLVRDVVIAVGDVLSLTAFFYGDGKTTSLPNTGNLACFCLPAKTGGGRSSGLSL